MHRYAIKQEIQFLRNTIDAEYSYEYDEHIYSEDERENQRSNRC